MENCLVGSSPPKPKVASERHTSKYHPTVWGDTFISHVSHNLTLCKWREEADILKSEVRKMLTSEDGDDIKLSLVDSIQRLGVAYHFVEEIEEILAKVNDVGGDDTDLSMVALRFRLLREHGYNVTSDVFKKFMDNKGKLQMESSCENLQGLLNLYEASHHRFHGEAILDNALEFATTSLRCMLPRLAPFLANQVLRALYRPLRKTLPRMETLNYISVYQHTQNHNETLLSFAKFDFNILQKLHQEEICTISKWWKEIDVVKNFPFARDRIVELYFWILVLYTEPKYSMARLFLTKVIAMLSIIDDMYDNYGTIEELELFTTTIQRMGASDANVIADLPEYMKLCYEELQHVYDEAEEEMRREARSVYGVESAKEAVKKLIRMYYEERQWLGQSDPPTLEEYMKASIVSAAYPALAVNSVVFMDNVVANEETFNWLLTIPKIVEAASTVCRLMDDIVSNSLEQEREHPPSSVECYVAQYGGTEEEAREALRGKVEEAWKDINEAFVRPTIVEKSVLLRVLNMARVMDLTYKESDEYTVVTKAGKERITALLVTPIEY